MWSVLFFLLAFMVTIALAGFCVAAVLCDAEPIADEDDERY